MSYDPPSILTWVPTIKSLSSNNLARPCRNSTQAPFVIHLTMLSVADYTATDNKTTKIKNWKGCGPIEGIITTQCVFKLKTEEDTECTG